MKLKIILVVASVCESLLNGKTMCLTLRTSSRMANASLISMLFVFGCSSSNEVQVASDELDSEDEFRSVKPWMGNRTKTLLIA